MMSKKEQGIHQVIDLKYIAMGDYVTPYKNAEDYDVILESIAEINRIKAGLEFYRYMIAIGYTLDELKALTIRDWLQGAELNVFNLDPRYNLNIPDTVYFYTSPLVTDLVKIGFSDHLPKRVKSLDQELCRELRRPFKDRTTPVLYIKASQLNTRVSISQLEAAFHFTLTGCRCKNEWFWREPVSTWLKNMFPSQTDIITQVLDGGS